MQQAELFYENIYEALRATVNQLGGPKEIGQRFWPEKSVIDARTLLLNCLNPDRKERLDPEQVILLLRWSHDKGYHETKHWLDNHIGYVPTPPLDPIDEQSHLTKIIANAAEVLERATQSLERLQGRKVELRRVERS